MSAAYANYLTERDNMRCRNIVISDLYKRLWGNRFKISNEQFTKIKFANDKTGWKLATSVGGVVTGERADIVIVDDPNDTMGMESELIRASTNMWFTEVLPTRLNNPQESSIIVIQQRLHEDDVSGTALTREMGFTHLMIPMEYDSTRHCKTVLNFEKTWEDPRTEDGELAWPDRFTQSVCNNYKRDQGPYVWSGQFQQSPEPRGGSIIKRDYWQLWQGEKFPDFEYVLAALDTAYTEKKENDPSAMVIMGVFRDEAENPKIMLMYAWQERLEFYDLCQKVLNTCIITPSPAPHPRFSIDRLLIEGKASGLSVAQEIYRLVGASGKFGIETVDPKKYGDKVSRVHSIQHIFADKMVYAPDRNWADMVINEVSVFPKGSHDDLVDCVSMGLRYLRDTGFALRRDETSLVREEDMMYRSPIAPLYEV